ncbi:hypothetical protein ABPG77_007073 [Micractinium sp. CCAP 211/92]
MVRPAQLGRLVGITARSATRWLHASAAASAAALPALAAPSAGPCGVPTSPERPSSQLLPHGNGLTPQQAFAAHSLAAEGSAPAAGDVDEVVARLREHLEAMFSPGPPPAGMCAVPLAAPAAAPASVPATTLRSSAQAVAARLTKPTAPEVPLTLEAALQPSHQARLLVEAHPPYRLSWANPAWGELAGLDWHEVEGQPCLEVVAASLARAEGAPAGLVDALSTHARGSAIVELLQDGVPLPVRVTCTPLLDRSGHSTRMLLVFAPIHTSISA